MCHLRKNLAGGVFKTNSWHTLKRGQNYNLCLVCANLFAAVNSPELSSGWSCLISISVQMDKLLECKERAWQMYRDGQVKAVVDSVPFQGLEQVPKAVEHMLSGAALGKVVVSAV